MSEEEKDEREDRGRTVLRLLVNFEEYFERILN